MMAGHPNETKPLGLRNIGFCLQVGGEDAAFRRNAIAGEWETKLAELAKADTGGYAHLVKVHAGKPHWMDTEDRIAVPWMEKFTRITHPEKIVWLQDDVRHSRFYWLAVPAAATAKEQLIRAQRHGQKFLVEAPEGLPVQIQLNDALADLDAPLEISRQGGKTATIRPARQILHLHRTLRERSDPKDVYSAVVDVP
jgi:hypothetical protein